MGRRLGALSSDGSGLAERKVLAPPTHPRGGQALHGRVIESRSYRLATALPIWMSRMPGAYPPQ